MKSSKKHWLPMRKYLRQVDEETQHQQKDAERLKEISDRQAPIINEVSNRIEFFSSRNHFSDKLGRFLSLP